MPGVLLCYTAASVGKEVFAKMVLFDKHAVGRCGSEGLPL